MPDSVDRPRVGDSLFGYQIMMMIWGCMGGVVGQRECHVWSTLHSQSHACLHWQDGSPKSLSKAHPNSCRLQTLCLARASRYTRRRMCILLVNVELPQLLCLHSLNSQALSETIPKAQKSVLLTDAGREAAFGAPTQREQ